MKKNLACIISITAVVVLLHTVLILNVPGAAAGTNRYARYPAQEAVLTAISPDTVNGDSPSSQVKLFTLTGFGLGLGPVQVTCSGPQENAIKPVFTFALSTRILLIATIAPNPLPGKYAVKVTADNQEISGVSITIKTATQPDDTKCIPCGDFAMTCNIQCIETINQNHKCPVCFSIDTDNGTTTKVGFDDGSYYTTVTDFQTDGVITEYYDSHRKICFYYQFDGTSSTLYDNSGKACYSMQQGTAENDVVLIVDGKTYTIHDNETWTCPDKSTWELDTSCTRTTLPATDTVTDNCTLIYQLPPCN